MLILDPMVEAVEAILVGILSFNILESLLSFCEACVDLLLWLGLSKGCCSSGGGEGSAAAVASSTSAWSICCCVELSAAAGSSSNGWGGSGE